MTAFHVRGIVWETDGKRPVLPSEATVECESEEGIAEALSDAYGWLASDFVVVEELETGDSNESGGDDGNQHSECGSEDGALQQAMRSALRNR
ncbi:hypothetical protein P2B10_21360 [Xanthomonas perforans]|nr:hypothetical protein [Xanthomonas citri]CEI11415.1 conserved hypothetical protein [Xanthomonas citri pv. citri]